VAVGDLDATDAVGPMTSSARCRASPGCAQVLRLHVERTWPMPRRGRIGREAFAHSSRGDSGSFCVAKGRDDSCGDPGGLYASVGDIIEPVEGGKEALVKGRADQEPGGSGCIGSRGKTPVGALGVKVGLHRQQRPSGTPIAGGHAVPVLGGRTQSGCRPSGGTGRQVRAFAPDGQSVATFLRAALSRDQPSEP
jgi:hypothetical protein